MRELSVKAYGIDLLLLPINYPQKLFEPDTRKTGMGGEIGREQCSGGGGGGEVRDRGKIGQAPKDEKRQCGSMRMHRSVGQTDERGNEKTKGIKIRRDIQKGGKYVWNNKTHKRQRLRINDKSEEKPKEEDEETPCSSSGVRLNSSTSWVSSTLFGKYILYLHPPTMSSLALMKN